MDVKMSQPPQAPHFIAGTISFLWIAVALTLFTFFAQDAYAQRVVRVSEPDAINPAEVSIAINPRNPNNIVGASFQTGSPPKPRAGSYTYVSMDGGRTWKTVPS